MTRPIEVVTPLKPSEALRLGRLRFPRPFRGSEYGPEPGQACARGAIFAGYGGGSDGTVSASFNRAVAFYRAVGGGDIGGPCPGSDATSLCHWTGETPETTLSMVYAVVHFNDIHHWDDDRIAGWLESRGL